jgi:hypothetical protein
MYSSSSSPHPPLVFTSTLLGGLIVLSFQSNPFSHSPFSQFPIFHHAFTMCVPLTCILLLLLLILLLYLLFLHVQDHCNTYFSTLYPFYRSTSTHHLKPPFRFLIGNEVIPVSSNNASSLTLYFPFPPDSIWENRIQPNRNSRFFYMLFHFTSTHIRKQFRLFCNHILISYLARREAATIRGTPWSSRFGFVIRIQNSRLITVFFWGNHKADIDLYE